MFGSQVLEVAIALMLLYLLLSLICSSIREGIEAVLKTRAADLERGIRELLHDPHAQGLAKEVYNHPLIFGLFKGKYEPGVIDKRISLRGANLPSYIPAKNFAGALMDIVIRQSAAPGTVPSAEPQLSVASLRSAAAAIPNDAVRRAVGVAIDSAQGDLRRAQANIEDWFNSGMDRVSGWYKRRTQNIIFAVGLVLTAAINADTITIAQSLMQGEALRRVIVAQAEVMAKSDIIAKSAGALTGGVGKRAGDAGSKDAPATDKATADAAKDIWAAAKGETPREQGGAATDQHSPVADIRSRLADVQRLGFPIGWGGRMPTLGDIAGHIPGWLMTALAISLGAPFWFDVLNKFMVIRSTVKPHEKSPEEGSEDRPAGRPAATRTRAAEAGGDS
jgi:hypothetical protein